ncbi:unnamed protein product [Ectocarpus sp. 12 AP-2014]
MNLLRVENVVSQSVRVCAYFVSALELRACVCIRCPIYSGIECFFARPGDASSSSGVMKKEEGYTRQKLSCVFFHLPSPFTTSLLDATRVQPSLSMVDRELETVPEGAICHHQGSVLYQLTRTGTSSGRCAS